MKKCLFGLQSYIHPSPHPPFTTSLLANLLLLWEKDFIFMFFKELPFSWNNNQINRLFLSFIKANGLNTSCGHLTYHDFFYLFLWFWALQYMQQWLTNVGTLQHNLFWNYYLQTIGLLFLMLNDNVQNLWSPKCQFHTKFMSKSNFISK